MEANKKVTELGLLDMVLRQEDEEEDERYNSEGGYQISLLSVEPEMISLVFTLCRWVAKTSVGNLMLFCDDMHVGEFIRYFGLEVYADIDKISLDQVWTEFYLTGRAVLEFDARPPFEMRYSKESKVQTLEDLRGHCEGLEG